MSHTSKEEYLESCRQRYPSRNRAGKSAMIDEVGDTLGWDRKHAIKALNNRVALGKQAKRRGSKPSHGEVERGIILAIWKHSEQPCGVRLKQTLAWLRQHIKLPSGPPGDDTFRRVFTAIDPKRFCECFIAHVRAIQPGLTDELIAIDGKTLRHSFDHADPESSIHIVSAWASGSGLSLGQLLVDGKTNEIAAIPKLLRKLVLNLLRTDRSIKDSMRGKRIRAAHCERTLGTLLKITVPK